MLVRENLEDPTPKKIQISINHKTRETFGAWMLMLLWMLDVGAGPRSRRH